MQIIRTGLNSPSRRSSNNSSWCSPFLVCYKFRFVLIVLGILAASWTLVSKKDAESFESKVRGRQVQSTNLRLQQQQQQQQQQKEAFETRQRLNREPTEIFRAIPQPHEELVHNNKEEEDSQENPNEEGDDDEEDADDEANKENDDETETGTCNIAVLRPTYVLLLVVHSRFG